MNEVDKVNAIARLFVSERPDYMPPAEWEDHKRKNGVLDEADASRIEQKTAVIPNSQLTDILKTVFGAVKTLLPIAGL